MPMMRAVAETTRPSASQTLVSLDPIMIDGTGMCGACRVIDRRRDEVRLRRRAVLRRARVDFDEAVVRKEDVRRRGAARGRARSAGGSGDADPLPDQDGDAPARSDRAPGAVGRGRPRATRSSARSPRRAAASSARTRSASRAAPSACRSATSSAASRSRTSRGAADLIRTKNVLPAICGRVCPVEHQCEAQCSVLAHAGAGRDRTARALRRRLGAHASARRRGAEAEARAKRRSRSSAPARPG